MSPWDLVAWVTSVGIAVIIVLLVILLTLYTVFVFHRFISRRKNVG